jgi:hypothetical protein
MTTYVYSKVRFDNAKDTRELIDASNATAELLIDAVKYRLADHVDQLVINKVESSVAGSKDGEAMIRVGDKFYSIKEQK